MPTSPSPPMRPWWDSVSRSMELEHEDAAGEQPFVVGTAVVALEAEEVRWYQRLDASTSRTAIMVWGWAGRTGATTPIRLPAGSSSSTSQRSPLSSRRRTAAAGDAAARASAGAGPSRPTRPVHGRRPGDVVARPIIPGASKLPEARSTDQPKTVS